MTQQAPVHRFPWRTTAVVVGIVVAASVLAGLLLARTRVDAPPPAVAPTVTPVATTSVEPLPVNADRQLTLLLNVRDDARAVMSSTLLGVGGPTGSLKAIHVRPCTPYMMNPERSSLNSSAVLRTETSDTACEPTSPVSVPRNARNLPSASSASSASAVRSRP